MSPSDNWYERDTCDWTPWHFKSTPKEPRPALKLLNDQWEERRYKYDLSSEEPTKSSMRRNGIKNNNILYYKYIL